MIILGLENEITQNSVLPNSADGERTGYVIKLGVGSNLQTCEVAELKRLNR